LKVAVFLNNKTEGVFNDIQHLVVPTPNINYSLHDEDNAHIQEGKKVRFVTPLPAHSSSIFLLSLDTFQISQQGSFTMTTSFLSSLEDQSTFLKYEIPINFLDMLRPQEMDIDEFAELWKDHGKEQVDTFFLMTVNSTDDLCAITEEALNWKPVGVRGDEVLFAAVEVSLSELCLVWVQHHDHQITLKIRADDNSLLQNLSKAIKKSLTK
jgi:hypothetical protein